MKVAVIFYHKNIASIYEPRWIEKCVDSIAAQTHTDFDIYELDYDGNHNQYACIEGHKWFHYSEEFDNHIHAMNWLIDEAFSDGADIVFNTNMDDFYDPTRFEKQIKCIENGADLVSSDFCYIEEQDGTDNVTRHMNICSSGDIAMNLNKDHNVIAHPCVAYSKRFWDGTLKYKDLLGWEDLELWKRGIKAGKKFHIIDEELLFYRIHQKQVTKEHKGIT